MSSEWGIFRTCRFFGSGGAGLFRVPSAGGWAYSGAKMNNTASIRMGSMITQERVRDVADVAHALGVPRSQSCERKLELGPTEQPAEGIDCPFRWVVGPN